MVRYAGGRLTAKIDASYVPSGCVVLQEEPLNAKNEIGTGPTQLWAPEEHTIRRIENVRLSLYFGHFYRTSGEYLSQSATSTNFQCELWAYWMSLEDPRDAFKASQILFLMSFTDSMHWTKRPSHCRDHSSTPKRRLLTPRPLCTHRRKTQLTNKKSRHASFSWYATFITSQLREVLTKRELKWKLRV